MRNLPEAPISGGVTVIDRDRVDEHPAAVYLAGLAKSSRRTMKSALNTVASIIAGDGSEDGDVSLWDVPWHHLRFQHVQAVRGVLAERYAHSTANRMLSALRGVLKAAWKLDLMTAEEYHKAASVESVSGERVPAGRSLSAGEVKALLDTCEQRPLGVRDAAIISVFYGCGVRRAELVSLNLGDYDRNEGELIVQGKGNKQRIVPVGGVTPALEDWLAVRGREHGPLFWGLGNRNRRGRLTEQAVYKMLCQRAKEAGVDALSPHDFRRTFVGDLLDAGADIATVQKMVGHADSSTTAQYDRRDKRAMHKAANLLHVPYRSLLIESRKGE